MHSLENEEDELVSIEVFNGFYNERLRRCSLAPMLSGRGRISSNFGRRSEAWRRPSGTPMSAKVLDVLRSKRKYF